MNFGPPFRGSHFFAHHCKVRLDLIGFIISRLNGGWSRPKNRTPKNNHHCLPSTETNR